MLCDEVRAKGFGDPRAVLGGVVIKGTWADVWRANLELRGPSHVLARFGEFYVSHLAQLDKLARKFPWGEIFDKNVPLRVEVTCKKSRIYHAGAAQQRFETALREDFGAEISADAEIVIKARIENDLCTLSVDTSGEPLHKRGHKEAIGKAPLRENMAALLLLACGYHGQEPVLDPMCGSGTFVLEAAEMALWLNPGRTRNFAFEKLVTFDAMAWNKLKSRSIPNDTRLRFYGSDRDQGAIDMAKANATRAGISAHTVFSHLAISDASPPEGPPGLVMVNPPYGTRLGDKHKLLPLYAALGKTMRERFSGWRVGLITTEQGLAKATGLPFKAASRPILHGGLRILLFQTAPLERP